MRYPGSMFLVAAGIFACVGSDRAEVDRRVTEVMRLEDTRPADSELGPILDALEDPDARVRAAAVRALGRLERPSLITRIGPALADDASEVRAQGFAAVAQAAFGGERPEALRLLLGWATSDRAPSDPRSRGALAHALGRVDPIEGMDLEVRTAVIVGLATADETVELGVALGLYDWARATRGAEPSGPPAMSWLTDALDGGMEEVPRVAALTLATRSPVPSEAIIRAAAHPDGQVRLAATTALSRLHGSEALLARLIDDADARVRVQALRSAREILGSERACRAALSALDDSVHHVRQTALGVLADPCPESLGVPARLEALASALPSAGPREWHDPTRAVLSLATIDPTRAAPLLGALVDHANPFVRAHGARAAGMLGSERVLVGLAEDAAPNVRTAAITALSALVGHEADTVYAAQLQASDPQLVLTAARLLEGSPGGARYLDQLVTTLSAFSAERRETSRDPRMMLIDRIREFGSPVVAPQLRAYLRTYDPVVAAAVADVLVSWGVEDATPAATESLFEPFPDVEELSAMRNTRVVLEMSGGGEIVIRLLPFEAPTNSARFRRLAAGGYFDGLTFHRVVSNFIIQGGSPGANEYFGDGPFTRDELEGSAYHRRGTVGLSTRGRDTGDAQIFINTVDNLRLDHNYTIFGWVERGMDVVDDVREGDVIVRARVEG